MLVPFANVHGSLSRVDVQRGISTFLVRRSGFAVSSGARTGAVTLIQRFGSALNLRELLPETVARGPPGELMSDVPHLNG